MQTVISFDHPWRLLFPMHNKQMTWISHERGQSSGEFKVLLYCLLSNVLSKIHNLVNCFLEAATFVAVSGTDRLVASILFDHSVAPRFNGRCSKSAEFLVRSKLFTKLKCWSLLSGVRIPSRIRCVGNLRNICKPGDESLRGDMPVQSSCERAGFGHSCSALGAFCGAAVDALLGNSLWEASSSGALENRTMAPSVGCCSNCVQWSLV